MKDGNPPFPGLLLIYTHPLWQSTWNNTSTHTGTHTRKTEPLYCCCAKITMKQKSHNRTVALDMTVGSLCKQKGEKNSFLVSLLMTFQPRFSSLSHYHINSQHTAAAGLNCISLTNTPHQQHYCHGTFHELTWFIWPLFHLLLNMTSSSAKWQTQGPTGQVWAGGHSGTNGAKRERERRRETARNGEKVRVFYLMWKKDIGMMEKSTKCALSGCFCYVGRRVSKDTNLWR